MKNKTITELFETLVTTYKTARKAGINIDMKKAQGKSTNALEARLEKLEAKIEKIENYFYEVESELSEEDLHLLNSNGIYDGM